MNRIFKGICTSILTVSSLAAVLAQPADSVIINVGKESKVVFIIKDKADLETMKHYDFQSLMNDMVRKLEARDSTTISKSSSEYLKETTIANADVDTTLRKIDDTWERDRNWDRDSDWDRNRSRNRTITRYSSRRTYHSFNIDLGMNNYLENGNFPATNNSLYSVKPWGSWYVSLNSVLRTRVTGKFFVEWGAGVSWYNFKFNNKKTMMSTDSLGVVFSEDPRDLNFTKSKLTAAYINISIVPMIDFGGNGRKPMVFNGDRVNFDRRGSFRIGVGPYVGYLLDSYTKTVYEDDDKHKTHTHNNYYLKNLRYGVRLQLGFRDTDIFFNYDLNNLFTEQKGPTLHAFSFGVTL